MNRHKDHAREGHTGPPPGAAPRPAASRRGGFLAQMKIRKKMIVLHTCFSLGLAGVLFVALRPAIAEVLKQSEMNEARLLLEMLVPGRVGDASPLIVSPHASVRFGDAAELGIDDRSIDLARGANGSPVDAGSGLNGARMLTIVTAADGSEIFALASVRIPEARRAIRSIYILLIVALLAVYGLVAAAIEVFVLPSAVYAPIRRILDADAAVQQGRASDELIPDTAIPADELGEIMRSRNASIMTIRRHEHDLADALGRLEEVASDLARKNHLLENARRNLAESDRLATLGMMSAGIAHELNTPLAVLKGLVEKLDDDPQGLDPAQAALMRRVVGRLERLGDSLLDFARARTFDRRLTPLRPLVDEAFALVRLDREMSARIELVNAAPSDLSVSCDADRMLQVLVNLVRNAVDAIVAQRSGAAETVTVDASLIQRDGGDWTSITVTDTGPGIDADLLHKVFEPFVTTGLDARGTGLGLAVVDGIVREHGGLVLARNRGVEPTGDRTGGSRGAVFEVLLPRIA
ncbi:MAG: HAMP domain-containing histidine kinase [Planctomycetes bacterium]|nr:HAMP domain-containing histidine kinase [Planctomycetota bacterium]